MNMTPEIFDAFLRNFPQHAPYDFHHAKNAMNVLFEAIEEKMQHNDLLRSCAAVGKQPKPDHVAHGAFLARVLENASLWEAVCSEPRWGAPLVVMALRIDDPQHLDLLLNHGAMDKNGEWKNSSLLHLMMLCCPSRKGMTQSPHCLRALCQRADTLELGQWSQLGECIGKTKSYACFLAVCQSGYADKMDTWAQQTLLRDTQLSWTDKINWLSQWKDAGLDLNFTADNRRNHILYLMPKNLLDAHQLVDLLKLGVNPRTDTPQGMVLSVVQDKDPDLFEKLTQAMIIQQANILRQATQEGGRADVMRKM